MTDMFLWVWWMPPTDYGKMMRNPVQGMVHIIIFSTEIPSKQDLKCWWYHKLCTCRYHFAPLSFVAIIPCPNFKVIYFQWLVSRCLCKQNTCCRSIYSHLIVAISNQTSRLPETNVICSHISRSFSITRLVPVQYKRVCVQGKSQILNWPWNWSSWRETITRELTWLFISWGWLSR